MYDGIERKKQLDLAMIETEAARQRLDTGDDKKKTKEDLVGETAYSCAQLHEDAQNRRQLT